MPRPAYLGWKRLIYRMHSYRGRKGETKAFTWTEYRDLLIAARRQLPGGNIVLVGTTSTCIWALSSGTGGGLGERRKRADPRWRTEVAGHDLVQV